ncbi:MAG TPA: hypothetical protein PLT65_03235 [Bacilli bacterium]|nr:hypothetical protein [Bacilli bacterium]
MDVNFKCEEFDYFLLSRGKGNAIIVIAAVCTIFVLLQGTHIYDILYTTFASICFIRIISLNIE